MQQTDEEYFMERLTDRWINHSLPDFVNSVSCGGITDYDGFGEPYFVNKKTLKLEDSRDSLDLSLFVKGKDDYYRIRWNYLLNTFKTVVNGSLEIVRNTLAADQKFCGMYQRLGIDYIEKFKPQDI